jgi:hypothetical protein
VSLTVKGLENGVDGRRGGVDGLDDANVTSRGALAVSRCGAKRFERNQVRSVRNGGGSERLERYRSPTISLVVHPDGASHLPDRQHGPAPGTVVMCLCQVGIASCGCGVADRGPRRRADADRTRTRAATVDESGGGGRERRRWTGSGGREALCHLLCKHDAASVLLARSTPFVHVPLGHGHLVTYT